MKIWNIIGIVLKTVIIVNQKKELRIIGLLWYEFLPFIPIIGIPLTIKYKDKIMCIENKAISFLTALIQMVSMTGLVFIILN